MGARRTYDLGFPLRLSPPPKPAKDKQNRTVQVSFTEAEYKRLAKIADGRPLATLLRNVALKHVKGLRG